MATLRALSPNMTDQELLQAVVDFFHERLKEDSRARAFLKQRRLNDPQLMECFQLGFADRQLGLALPKKESKTGRLIRGRLTEVGIYRGTGHGHFNGCIVVPVFDADGSIANLYGRKITRNLRRGTPQHMTLANRVPEGIWNVESLRDANTVVLCSSIIDGLTLWSAGMTNVIGACCPLSDADLNTLKAADVNDVVLAFDNTQPGNETMEIVAAQLAEIDIGSSRIPLPPGMDVNDYAVTDPIGFRRLTADVLQKPHSRNCSRLPAPQPQPRQPVSDLDVDVRGTEILIHVGDRRWRIRGLEKQLSYDRLKVNLMVLRMDLIHVDTFDLYSSRHRATFITRAAEELYVEPATIQQDLGKVLLKLEELQDQMIRNTLAPAEEPPPTMSPDDERAALQLLQCPNLMERILKDIETCGLVGEETNKLIGYLVATSRKLERPLALMIQSSSAAGKTSLMEAILALMPPEEQIRYSAMTGQSLYYMGTVNLKHKILALAEEEGTQQAAYALKLLQSEGQLRIAATGRNADTGRLETEDYVVEGPSAILLTTTAEDPDPELENRCITLRVNEQTDQTAAIHAQQRSRYTLEARQAEQQRAAIQALHQNAQRLLEPITVVIPWADQLTFRADQTRMRRDHAKYLSLIASITLLHRFQRPRKIDVDDTPYIEASIQDIETAGRLAAEALGQSLDSLMPQTRQLLLLLDDYVNQQAQEERVTRSEIRFTQRDVRETLGWGDFQLRRHLKRLIELEYVLPHSGCRRNQRQYELIYNGEGRQGQPFLLGLIDATKLSYVKSDTQNDRSQDQNDGRSMPIRSAFDARSMAPKNDVSANGHNRLRQNGGLSSENGPPGPRKKPPS